MVEPAAELVVEPVAELGHFVEKYFGALELVGE